MTRTNDTSTMAIFNQTYKEAEDIYHNYAKSFHLSDTVFWVLYSLWEKESAYTQTELCADWSYPPQTVNSALKHMEQEGIIELVLISGSRKNKQIFLTPKGEALADKVIAPLIQAEQDSFAAMNLRERSNMLFAMQKHIALLKKNIEHITNVSSED